MATFYETQQMISTEAHSMGLVGASGHVDMGQLESSLLYSLRLLAETVDLDAFMGVSDPLLTTSPGNTTYALPEDFGRLIHPNERRESGLFISSDGSGRTALQKRHLIDIMRLEQGNPCRPTSFALVDRQLQLFPTPDAGINDTNYLLHLVYIKEVTPDNLDVDVTLPDSSFLSDMTLARMAIGLGHANAPALAATAERSRVMLVNHQSRISQAFQRGDRISRISTYGRSGY